MSAYNDGTKSLQRHDVTTQFLKDLPLCSHETLMELRLTPLPTLTIERFKNAVTDLEATNWEEPKKPSYYAIPNWVTGDMPRAECLQMFVSWFRQKSDGSERMLEFLDWILASLEPDEQNWIHTQLIREI